MNENILIQKKSTFKKINNKSNVKQKKILKTFIEKKYNKKKVPI